MSQIKQYKHLIKGNLFNINSRRQRKVTKNKKRQ